jgi:tetratricopeptide (TPR) repeat protein/transcriptional regulator with XRE-family HTH domain
MAGARQARFGGLLKRYRVAAGLTQEELAERAGLSAKGISDLERGARTSPRRDTVALLAGALGLTAHDRATLEAAARQRGALSAPPITSPRDALSQAALPFVGREDERALLDQSLDGAGAPLLVFAGEPGIGKSRLLREAAERAAERDWAVLAGGCHRHSGQEPFAPFTDIIVRSLERLPSAARRERLRGCARLARLAPEIAELEASAAQISPLPPEQERRLTFAAVTRYLANAAGPAGVLLALDDLQWAGADALDLLAYIVRAEPSCPLRVVAAYRDTEIRSHYPLAMLLADLAREGLAERALLSPLASADAERLLGALFPQGDASLRRSLLQRAGGLPFFLVSCAQGLSAGALHATQQGGDIPWSVSETIRQRVAALPEGAAAVLQIAAVAGSEARRSLLLQVAARAHLDEEQVLAGLEAACSARLLQEDGPDAYMFAHDLVREVIASDLSAARRALLHRQIAEALELEPGTPPEILAYHYDLSDARDKALIYLERAGDRAFERFANAEAEQRYRQLVEALTTRGQPREAAEIQMRLATTLRRQGRYEGALAQLEAAAEAYRLAGDRDRQARALAEAGRLYGTLGRPEEGLAKLEPFLAGAAKAEPSPTLAALYSALAGLLYSSALHVRARFDEQLAAAERAVEIARAVGDERTLLVAEEGYALALSWNGRDDEADTVLRGQVIPMAERLGDYPTLCRELLNMGVYSMAHGDYDRERQYTDQALAIAERVGDLTITAYALARRGIASFTTGDWRAAREESMRALALMRRGDPWVFSTTPAYALAHLCFAQGKWDEAAEYFKQVQEVQRLASDNEIRLSALLAERDLLRGEPASARERLAPLMREPYRANRYFEDLRALLAWALAESGEAEAAAALIQETLARVRARGQRPALADILWCSARVSLLMGAYQPAQAALDEALDLARVLPKPYTEIKALFVYGQLRAAQGDPIAARERLEAALAICARLGERLYAEHIERALTALSQR